MNTQEFKLRRKVLSIAVAAALTSLVSAAHADTATSTSGILVDSGTSGVPATLITGGNQEVDITSDIVKAGATTSGAALWMEGVGNTVNNEAIVSRTSNTGNTYGVYLGDYSVARGDSANKAVAGVDATAGAYGSTTMRITIPSTAGTYGLNAAGLVGKQLVMAGVVIDGEAQAGDTRTIRSAVAVSGSPNTFDIVVNKAWARKDAEGNPITQVGNSYNLIAGSGLNIFNNSGTVEAIYTGNTTANIRGFETNVAGDYVINNTASGVIKGEHTSVGTPQGIDAGGDVTTMEVNNAGLITAIRTNGTLALVSNTFYQLTGTGTGVSGTKSIGSGAAIYSQEELEAITINNTGNIIGIGDLNPGIYMRAGEQNVVNAGTISGSRNGVLGSYTYGMGIGAVSDGGEIRTLSLTNTESGVINGAVLAVNANAYRWFALSNFDAAGAADPTFSNLNNRLSSNGSNWGQLDSTIENEGTINGKVYLSNGSHTITNTGTMNGGIDLDQRDTQTVQSHANSAFVSNGAGSGPGFTPGELGENTIQTAVVKTQSTSGSKNQTFTAYAVSREPGQYSASAADASGSPISTVTFVNSLSSNASSTSTAYTGLFTVVGTKSFTFENAGTFTGDLLIHTASSNALGHTVESEVTLSPYIYGAGAVSANSATNFSNIHGFSGNLIVVTTAGGEIDDNITIAPKAASGTVIRDGEFYRVANGVKTDLAGTTAATDLPSISGNGLVSWTPSYNNTGALVIESEVSAANVTGISSQGASALNALMSANSVLGSQVQNLSDEAAVLRASEQIRPEVNGAQLQALLNVQDKVSGLVDSRLGDTHLAALTGKSGVATGNSASNTGVWFQGFGGKGDQDRRNNIDGYNTNTYGFALGADQQLGDGSLRVGGVLSYGQSAVNAQGSNTGNRSNINSYQGTIYASKLLDGWYLNGSLGLGNHSFDTKRVVLANSVAGSFDAWQYSAKLDAGYPVNLGKFTLVPLAGLTYIHLTQDGYTESGLGALSVNGRDTNSLRSGVGAKGIVSLYEGDIKAKLELRAIWNHEFANTAQDTTARFAAGGSSFTTSGISPERDSANLGASLRLVGANKTMQQSLNLSYDAEIKNQYQSHTASLQARFDF